MKSGESLAVVEAPVKMRQSKGRSKGPCAGTEEQEQSWRKWTHPAPETGRYVGPLPELLCLWRSEDHVS